jgi:type I restriction enzyme S subunit
MKGLVNSLSDLTNLSENDEIPDGWERKKLKEIFAWSNGKSLPKKKIDQGEFPVFGGNGINGYHSKYLIEKDSLVIGRVGAGCGNVHLAPKKSWITDNAIYTSEYPESANLKFYYLLLKNLNLNNISGGSGQPFISQTLLDEIYIAVPPLAEQQRIVARVEALLTHVNAAHDRLSQVPLIIKKFRQGVLAAACTGRLTEEWRQENPESQHEYCEKIDVEIPDDWDIPREWQWATINGMCEKVVDCPHSTPKWTQSGPICIRTSEIKSCYLDLSHARFVSDDTYRERIQRLEPKEMDIVYSREGTLGQAAIIPKGVKICLGQRIMLLRAGPQCFPLFLTYIINSPQILKIVNELTTGSTSPHINVGDVKKFPVPLPSLAEQHEIVRLVNILFERADEIEREVVAATKRTEALTQAVLGKAFRGELVPSGMAEGWT